MGCSFSNWPSGSLVRRQIDARGEEGLEQPVDSGPVNQVRGHGSWERDEKRREKTLTKMCGPSKISHRSLMSQKPHGRLFSDPPWLMPGFLDQCFLEGV